MEYGYRDQEARKRYKTEHYKKQRQSRRDFVDQFKDRPCEDCGQSFPAYVMDFDHRDPNTKIAGIADLCVQQRSFEVILDEIRKCDLVCANCHRIRTHNRRQATV